MTSNFLNKTKNIPKTTKQPEDVFISNNLKILKIIGVWSENDSYSPIQWIKFIITVLISATVIIPQMTHVIRKPNGISEFTETVAPLISSIKSISKFILLFFSSKDLRSLIMDVKKSCKYNIIIIYNFY